MVHLEARFIFSKAQVLSSLVKS